MPSSTNSDVDSSLDGEDFSSDVAVNPLCPLSPRQQTVRDLIASRRQDPERDSKFLDKRKSFSVGTKVGVPLNDTPADPLTFVEPSLSSDGRAQDEDTSSASPARNSLFARYYSTASSEVSSSGEADDSASQRPPLIAGSREYKRQKKEIEEAAKQARKQLEIEVGQKLLEVKELAVKHANELYKSLTSKEGVRSRDKKKAGKEAMLAKEAMIDEQSGPVMDEMELELQRIDDDLKAALDALLLEPTAAVKPATSTDEGAEKAPRNDSPLGVGDRRSGDLEDLTSSS